MVIMGADWVIALHDEDSQTAQGMLSHQVRLEEIESNWYRSNRNCLIWNISFRNSNKLYKATTTFAATTAKPETKKKAELQHDTNCQTAKYSTGLCIAANSNWQIKKQLDLQLEEDAMQRDDLEIDLHALALKLEAVAEL
jgi:chromosome segregation protein